VAPRSSIDRNPAAKLAVEKLLAEGCTIDEVHEAVTEYGLSRSAVGRYARTYRPMVEAIIRDKAVRAAMQKHLPDGVDTGLVDVALHQAQREVLRQFDAMGDDEELPDAAKVQKTVNSLRGVISAMRDKRAFQEEIRASERLRAADAAVQAMKEAGAGDAQADFIKRRILGMPEKAA
jgi:phage tail protein X